MNESGSNTAIVESGESVLLRMYAAWDDEPPTIGFAGSIFDILGVENWDTGEVAHYDNKFDDLTDDGDLQANNDILGIESFQLPPFFNPQFWEGNPIFLYEIEWTPDDYTARTVRLTDANHQNNSFYIDDFGTSVEFTQMPSEGATIFIVPAPSTCIVLGVGGLAITRWRHRRML